MTIEIDEATKRLLQKFGFTETTGKAKLYEYTIDGDTTAYVDFRKQNGRRLLRVGDNFDADPDSVEILKQFKEERDKLLQSSGSRVPAGSHPDASSGHAETTEHGGTHDTSKSSGDVVERQNNNIAGDTLQSSSKDVVQSHEAKRTLDNGTGQETILNNQSSIHTPPDVKIVPAQVTSHLLDVIKNDYEADILEVFGESGSCKTKLMVHLALEGKRDGKKVRFVDTERNLRKAEMTALGDSYQYLPGITDITNFCKNLPKGVDIIIIDSIGYPVLTDFAKMTANQKGASLLNMITWFGDLKDWAINNNKLVIVTNQPDSDFGKEKDYINRPFGDKARFAAKEIWEMKRLGMHQGVTKSAIRTFRSRIKGYGLDVAQIEINDSGTVIRM